MFTKSFDVDCDACISSIEKPLAAEVSVGSPTMQGCDITHNTCGCTAGCQTRYPYC